MQKASRLHYSAPLTAVVALTMALVACTSPTTGSDAGTDAGTSSTCPNPALPTCTCMTKADCGAGLWICTAADKCVPICNTSADCKSGELCENAICLPPGCNSDTECSSGQQCVSGVCQTRIGPSDVTACSVQPADAVIHAGDTKSFSILAEGAVDGGTGVIAYEPQSGEVTWTVAAAVGTNGASSTTSPMTVTGASTGGTGTVAATVNGITCTPSNVVDIAAVASSTVQVTVVDDEAGTPISGASVVVVDSAGNTETGTTGSNGAAEVTSVALGTATITAFPPSAGSYDYVTVGGQSVAAAGLDIAIFLKKNQAPGTLGNTMTPASFANLQDLSGGVHLAINGPSISGNLIDLSLSTLLGSSVPTMVNLGGTSTTVNLPNGIVIGLDQQMFKGSYLVTSDPGLHAVWGIGGNVVLSDVLGVISGAVGGGSIDIGSILSALLPVLSEMQSAVSAGQTFTAGGTGTVTLNYDTLLRISALANVPFMPTYMVNGTATNFGDAVVLVGALYEPQGLVPLGITAGTNGGNGTSTTPDGIVSPITVNNQTYGPGQLPVSFALFHDGLEGSPQVAVALAANFSGLTGGSSGPLTLSGLVTIPGTPLLFKNNPTGPCTTACGSSNVVSFSSTAGATNAFMNVPTAAVYSAGTGSTSATLSFTEIAAGTGATAGPTPDAHRLDVTDTADTTGTEWQIYFPAGTGTITMPALPPVPTGFTDPFATAKPTVTLQNISLKLKSGVTYNSIFNSTSDTSDNLTADIDSFAVYGIQ